METLPQREDEAGASADGAADLPTDSVSSHVNNKPIPKKTERQVVLKLELGVGAPAHQMGIVANTLYNIDKPPEIPASNNQHWTKTDDELYNIARKSYDDILNQFQMKPQVYRFESTKEKMWADFARIERELQEKQALEEMQKASAFGKAKRVKRKLEKEQQLQKEREAKHQHDLAVQAAAAAKPSLDEEIATFLDPFDVPPPWVREVRE